MAITMISPGPPLQMWGLHVGNAKCNVWNYCFCDGGCVGGTVAKGTCELRNQANAFYPRHALLHVTACACGQPEACAQPPVHWACLAVKLHAISASQKFKM